jgi:L-amino acid N-acyltransferase YncA
MNERHSVYDICVANAKDIPELLALQAENQISRDGALSIEFSAVWYERAVRDMPIVIARREGHLAGFLVSSSPEATQHLALVQAKFGAYPAGAGAYNSGPLCIAAKERGHGLVAKLFNVQRSLLPGREGVAFIRRDNSASRLAHAKYGFREVAEFSHSGVEYLVVAYSAAHPE